MFSLVVKNHIAKIVGFFVFVGLFVNAQLGGTLGQIGPDNDDLMRLIQVRDFFSGQSWFDLHQYRLGSDGTLMHWSRIADIPLIILITFFNFFLPLNHAEIIAFTLWPVLSAMLLITGLIAASRHLPASTTPIFAGILIFFYLISHHRFLPGAIDHHNLQLALLAIALGGLLDPKMGSRSYIYAAIALALTFTIGIEISIFSAVMCIAVGCLWAYYGEKARKAVGLFGGAFALTLALVFFATTAPQNYITAQCDSYSGIVFLIGLCAGLGLALTTWLIKGTIFSRLVALIALGIICVAIIIVLAPHCLSNPLANLPDDARLLWLNNIGEAKSIWQIPLSLFLSVPHMLGVQFFALIICGTQFFKCRDKFPSALFFTLILSGIVLTVYQARFLQFGLMFSILPLAYCIASFFDQASTNSTSRINSILAFALSIPFTWSIPYKLYYAGFVEDEGPDTFYLSDHSDTKGCYGPNTIEALNRLPTGRLVTGLNAAPVILDKTKHAVLGGNYHRNVDGIINTIRIYNQGAVRSHEILKNNKIDHLVFCYPTKFTAGLVDENEESLANDLSLNIVPDFLSLVASPAISDEGRSETVRIYRVF